MTKYKNRAYQFLHVPSRTLNIRSSIDPIDLDLFIKNRLLKIGLYPIVLDSTPDIFLSPMMEKHITNYFNT
jgi:hypothetical protein